MAEPRVRRATWRMGARELRRLQSAVVVLICLLLALFLRPLLLTLIETRDFQVCQSNALKISLALQTYARDWDDAYPPAATWMDHARTFMAGTATANQAYFHCPRDKSGAPSSYAYNELFEGIALNLKSADPRVAAHAEILDHPDRAPLVFERHGGAANAHLELADWDAVKRLMTRPHELGAPTGTYIKGNGQPSKKSDDDFLELAGKRF